MKDPEAAADRLRDRSPVVAAADEPRVALPRAVPAGLRDRLGPVRRVMFFGKNMSRTRCTGGLVDALQRHGVEVRWRNLVTMRRR